MTLANSHQRRGQQVRRDPVDVVVDDDGTPAASNRMPVAHHRGTGYLPHRYAVAGLITVASQVALPELEFFRAPWLGKDVDIEIRVGPVGQRTPRRRARLIRFEHPTALRYEEHLGRFGANFALELGDRIQITVNPLLARSPHVLYTNVIEALLRLAVAAKGGMLLHSACIELDGRGLMLSARTDTGKTGTVLRLLRERGGRFLSDDMTIISPDGAARCFPKPLTISSHTLHAVDPGDLRRRDWTWLNVASRVHSKGGRGIGLALSRMNIPIMSVNAVTQILVPPPKYHADRLVPCDVVERTEVSDLFVIERGAPALADLAIDDAVDELVANTDDAYGFPPFRHLAPLLTIDGFSYPELRERERQVLRAALSRMRVRRLASDCFGWADEIPRLLAAGSAGAEPAGGTAADLVVDVVAGHDLSAPVAAQNGHARPADDRR